MKNFKQARYQGGFSLIPHPDHLLTALPAIYRQLVGG